MKLIIAGASGYVATEVVQQSLRMKEIHTVVALARKPVVASSGVSPAEAAKLRSVVIDDYETYPEHTRREFEGADACIWTVSITPTKAHLPFQPWDEVQRVCQKCTLAGFRAMVESSPARPFRFLYMSGDKAERDQTKKPVVYPAYLLLRGETENQVLAFAASQQPQGTVEACIARPAMITGHRTYWQTVAGAAMRWSPVATVTVEEVAAAMLQQVRDGFEKETLSNNDLKRIGSEVLKTL
ncbi:succinate-semialdehyde dehydrogenase [Echria macrotheca]|uniref:Succinate-semialdehyde dehydrogenase n=1 Tax=Echria macrotheca TaxID=438768 RepID=A0AAJ0F7W1_9PEZI|nr:succinate-semialdehyde dehydrogenase [Echria macrotheca]